MTDTEWLHTKNCREERHAPDARGMPFCLGSPLLTLPELSRVGRLVRAIHDATATQAFTLNDASADPHVAARALADSLGCVCEQSMMPAKAV